MHILFHLGFFLFDFVTKICLFITYGVLEIKSGDFQNLYSNENLNDVKLETEFLLWNKYLDPLYK